MANEEKYNLKITGVTLAIAEPSSISAFLSEAIRYKKDHPDIDVQVKYRERTAAVTIDDTPQLLMQKYSDNYWTTRAKFGLDNSVLSRDFPR